MSIKSHASFAASNSKMWVSCPGSIPLSKNAPEKKDSAASTEGTWAHELMEIALKEKVTAAFAAELLYIIEGYEAPQEMIEHIQRFVDYVRMKVAERLGSQLIVEKKVYLDALHITEAFGTPDVVIVEPFGVLHVIDLKYGSHHVSPIDNYQLIYYALGVCYEHGFDFAEVHTTIFQPRVGAGLPRTDIIDIDKLYRFEFIFKDAIEKAEEPDAEKKHLNSGEWCYFCRARPICPEVQKPNVKKAIEVFGPLLTDDDSFIASSSSDLTNKQNYELGEDDLGFLGEL